jgi:hypothetical protein
VVWIIIGGILLILAYVHYGHEKPEICSMEVWIENKGIFVIYGTPGQRPIRAKQAPWLEPDNLVDCPVDQEIEAMWLKKTIARSGRKRREW